MFDAVGEVEDQEADVYTGHEAEHDVSEIPGEEEVECDGDAGDDYFG